MPVRFIRERLSGLRTLGAPRRAMSLALSAFSLLALAAGAVEFSALPAAAQTPTVAPAANPVGTQSVEISKEALEQMAMLKTLMKNLPASERKVSTGLLFASRDADGVPHPAKLPVLGRGLETDAAGRVRVDIKAVTVTDDLLNAITAAGGRILSPGRRSGQITAYLPLKAVRTLAERSDIRHMRQTFAPRTGTFKNASSMVPFRNAPRRAAVVGSFLSEGDTAHSADIVREQYAASGQDVKVGVMSTSNYYIENSQTIGELPDDVITIPDYDGREEDARYHPDPIERGEGTAMMEIVHDLAPDAKLYFASAFIGEDSFAEGIRKLRDEGCQIIVDDIQYFLEPAFQDGIIAQAINDVTSTGTLYFSAAGNSGNMKFSNSSAWEGDFDRNAQLIGSVGGQSIILGYTHRFFASRTFNGLATTAKAQTPRVAFDLAMLQWADPQGGSGNDYDLYILDSGGTKLVDASIDTQQGYDDPLEQCTIGPEERAYVVLYKGNSRYLRFYTSRSKLQVRTSGVSYGHNAGENTVSVGAVGAQGRFIPFNLTSRIESFSSDGPRRVFFDPLGTPYTPNAFLEQQGGGKVLVKPDISAADGVQTSLSGFNPFYGTSAAAPHAAAIAALVKSYKPNITNNELRLALRGSCIDIEGKGIDPNSGNGIVMAPKVITFLNSFFDKSSVKVTDITAHGATIRWKTNLPSDNQVEYGLGTALGTVFNPLGLVTEHSVPLTGLLPDTRYYYRVSSTTPTASLTGKGDLASFVTLKALPKVVITNTSIVRTDRNQLVVTFTLVNQGGFDANNVQILAASLSNSAPVMTMPVGAGLIKYGQSKDVSIVFKSQPRGTYVSVKASGSYTPGSVVGTPTGVYQYSGYAIVP